MFQGGHPVGSIPQLWSVNTEHSTCCEPTTLITATGHPCRITATLQQNSFFVPITGLEACTLFACVVVSFNRQLDAIWKWASRRDCLEKVFLLASGQSVQDCLDYIGWDRPTVGVTIPLVEASELCKSGESCWAQACMCLLSPCSWL